ncbi:MAG: flagellar basal body P-ring protein FlgI [Fimbriimonadaceae bacterium]
MILHRPQITLILAMGATLAGAQAGAPATPPPPAPVTSVTAAIPLSQLSLTQLQGELRKTHADEALFSKRALRLASAKVAGKTLDGFTLDQVTAKLNDLRTQDEMLCIEIQRRQDDATLKSEIETANTDGIEVQVEAIAKFRGMRDIKLAGTGLVIGLEGTGDSTKSQLTQIMYANYLKSLQISIASVNVAAKDVAVVHVSATLRPMMKPGTTLDVTVSALGDAKSLQGGQLVLTPLYLPTDTTRDKVIATAEGGLSIGGFNAIANGSRVQRNHVNVGVIPGGGEVQNRVETQVVFQDGGERKLYLDLDEANPTTCSRIVSALNAKNPLLQAVAVDSTTIAITVPSGRDAESVESEVLLTSVFADTPAKVVINERTGTIVIGGNVTIGPAMVVNGNLSIRIDTENSVSQPGPLSSGQTTTVSNSTITAGQEGSKIAIIRPTTKIWDLAKLFQALNLQPNDVIKILTTLQEQGALKARIEIQ